MSNTSAHKPGYKHTPLGWIPEEWSIMSVGEAAKIYVGRDLKEDIFSDHMDCVYTVPVYSNTVEGEGLYGYYSQPEYTGDSLTVIGRGVGLGTAFTRKGSYGAIGRLLVLFPNDDFSSHFMTEYINGRLRLYTESSGIPQLTGESLSQYRILCPPKTEQQKIATILSTWDEAIQKTQQLIEQLKQRNKGLMQQLLIGKKRLKGFSGKWETHNFDDCFRVLRSYSVSRDGLHYDVGSDGIYCIHYGDIHSRYNSAFLDFDVEAKVPQLKSVDLSVNQDDYLKNGDVIIADASEDYEGVGTAIEVANLGNKTAVGGLHTIVLRVSRKGIAPGYLAFLFASQHLRNQLRKKATGISVYSISKTSLRTLSFQLPDIAEQKAITKALKGANTELKLYEQQLIHLQEQKKGLMQQLLSGEVRVKTKNYIYLMAKPQIQIAISYDFDGTLAPGNMQEHSFIPKLGIDAKDFWDEVKSVARNNDMNEILAYMGLMLEKGRNKRIELSKQAFQEYGKGITFFRGVEEYFDVINAYAKLKGANIDHYIISSGLRDILRGTSIARHFKMMYASGYQFDQHGVAEWPALAVDYTTKTQYLFRINKGIDNAYDNSKINKFMREDERPMPFRNMIYIGDGETDIPAMKMVKSQGGTSIAVYNPDKRKTRGKPSLRELCEKLIAEDRANYMAKADYSDGSDLVQIIKLTIDRIVAYELLNQFKK